MPLIQPNFLCAYNNQTHAPVRGKISLTHGGYVKRLPVSGNALWTHNRSLKGYRCAEMYLGRTDRRRILAGNIKVMRGWLDVILALCLWNIMRQSVTSSSKVQFSGRQSAVLVASSNPLLICSLPVPFFAVPVSQSVKGL